MTVFEAPLLVLLAQTALKAMHAKHFPAAFSAASQSCWELPLIVTVPLVKQYCWILRSLRLADVQINKTEVCACCCR